MSLSPSSVHNGEEGEGAKAAPSISRKTDDGSDAKKSQAQRLLEFEMWTNEKTLKDMEYSQRRTEKKQRSRERKRDYQKKFWRKLYLPSVLGMVIGTFLTFCSTLQSLAGGTFLWDARGMLVVVGPVLLGLGFLGLMLAAACTFKPDQEVREKPPHPPADFIFYRYDFRTRRRSAAVRSLSIDTTDLALPDDLDPNRNFVGKTSAWSPSRNKSRNGSVSRHNSISSGSRLMPNNSYSSTASWVQCVSASHSQQLASLTRQNSDSNIRSSPTLSRYHQKPRQSLTEKSATFDLSGSQTDLNIACTRSMSSSGYQSASDSTHGTMEYTSPRRNSQQCVNYSRYSPLRRYPRRSTFHTISNMPVRESRQGDRNRNGYRNYRRSLDSGVRYSPVVQKQASSIHTPPPTLRHYTSVTVPKSPAVRNKMQTLNSAPVNENNSKHLYSNKQSLNDASSKCSVRLPPSLPNETGIHEVSDLQYSESDKT